MKPSEHFIFYIHQDQLEGLDLELDQWVLVQKYLNGFDLLGR